MGGEAALLFPIALRRARSTCACSDFRPQGVSTKRSRSC